MAYRERLLVPIESSRTFAQPFVKLDGIPHPVSAPEINPATFRRIPLAPGARGTTQTLTEMAELAIEGSQDPYFVQEARGIIRGIASKNYEAEERKILDYVKTRVDYRQDPAFLEWIQSPGWTLYLEGQGDCDDMATLITAFGLAAGHGAAFRAVRLDPTKPDEFSHVYAVLGYMDPNTGEIIWSAADPVAPKAVLGWEPPEEQWIGPPNDLVIVSP